MKIQSKSVAVSWLQCPREAGHIVPAAAAPVLCCAGRGEEVTLMVNVNDTLMDCSGRWAGPIIDDTCTSQLSLSRSRSGYSKSTCDRKNENQSVKYE